MKQLSTKLEIKVQKLSNKIASRQTQYDVAVISSVHERIAIKMFSLSKMTLNQSTKHHPSKLKSNQELRLKIIKSKTIWLLLKNINNNNKQRSEMCTKSCKHQNFD